MSDLLSFIDAAKNAPDPQTQPDGQYRLAIAKGEVRKDKNDNNYIVWYFTIENPERSPAKGVRFNLMGDDPNLSDQVNELRIQETKHFMQAFQIDPEDLKAAITGGNFDAFRGKTGWAILKEVDSDDYGLQNEIKRFIVETA